MFGALMDQSLALQRATVAQDASAGATRTWSTVLTQVQAGVQGASSREVDNFARRNMQIDTVIYSETDFDTVLSGGLQLGDRFLDSGGRYYVVQGVIPPVMRSISTLYKVGCKRLVG